MTYEMDERDRQRCTEILEQRKQMGSRTRDSPERTTLGELGLDPTATVIVSDGRWAFDNIFHLTSECHHLQGAHSEKEAQQLRDDWLLCWNCEKAEL